MQSSLWTFLKLMRIGFGAMEVAKIDVAGIRQSAKGILRWAARDFLWASLRLALAAQHM
jgi:hypothetical protein